MPPRLRSDLAWIWPLTLKLVFHMVSWATRTGRNHLKNRSRHYDVWYRGHRHPGIEILIHLWYHFMSNCFNSLPLRYNLLIILYFYVYEAVRA